MRSVYKTWNRALWRVCVSLCVVILAASSPQASARKADSRDDDMRKEFETRIQNYMAIRQAAMATVPALPREGVTGVDMIEAHERDLADAVRALRPGAARGDLFTPGVSVMFRGTIRRVTSGPEGWAALEMIFDDGNPESPESPAIVDLAVNRAYPSDAPLSSVPPSLLQALPELPEGLEYRFVGKNLILRDAEANLILDIIFNAVPPST